MCELRDYRPGDEAFVFDLVKTVLSEYGLETSPATTDQDLADIGRSYINNGGIFRILEDAGRIIGSYGIYRLSTTTCELRKMYLQAPYRGRGWGRRMLTEAIEKARALGFTEMTLETNTCLKEGLTLYKRFGFREYRPEHVSSRCNIAMRIGLAEGR